MGSDISRRTFDPNKHYSQVVMQQGRVQLDADWNEQQEIIQHRIKTETRDIIGSDGVPHIGGGFEFKFTPDGRDLLISPGRIYVDGMLCENTETTIHIKFIAANCVELRECDWMVNGRAFEPGQWVEVLHEDKHPHHYFQITNVCLAKHQLTFSHRWEEFNELPERKMRRVMSYTTQPHYPEPAYTAIDPITKLRELKFDHQHLFFAYLDVWQRVVTGLDDSHIQEVALDGPDTATRCQILWQVKIDHISHSKELEALVEEQKQELAGIERLEEKKNKQQARFEELEKEKDKERKEIERLEEERRKHLEHAHHERLTQEIVALRHKIEQLDHTIATHKQNIVKSEDELILDKQKLQKLDEDIRDKLQAHDCGIRPDKWAELIEHPTGTLNVNNLDYSGSENQLYRVEIHDVAPDKKTLTFKWARDNASHVASVVVNGATGNVVTVSSAGQGGILNFNPGQFVEVLNDQTELKAQPGTLVKIDSVNYETNQLMLDSLVGKSGERINIRLWNGKDDVNLGEASKLKCGIQITFSEGTYNTSDYWLIPARTSTKAIEWPFYEIPDAKIPNNLDKRPIPQHRHGVHHHYIRLACIHYHKRPGLPLHRKTYDNRRHFAPLPNVIHAMHIVEISWKNDQTYKHDDLIRKKTLHGGLKITFDTKLDDTYIERMAAAMIVTLETVRHDEKRIIVINRKFVLDPTNHHTIVWHWHENDHEDKDDEKIKKWFHTLLGSIFGDQKHPVRVRVMLKGSAIWSKDDDRCIYLDGQSFGEPVKVGDPRIALGVEKEMRKRSGAGLRASDFESWFYIV